MSRDHTPRLLSSVPETQRLLAAISFWHRPQWKHREKHQEQLSGDALLHGQIPSEERQRGAAESQDWVRSCSLKKKKQKKSDITKF